MNKSSKIRKVIESYGFQQIKSKNCFISYTKEFCFQINIYKVAYNSRWAIEYSVNMLNSEGYELYQCPYEFNMYLDGGEVTLSKWSANGERNPDKHVDSMVFVIEEYIMPYFERVSIYARPDDFENFITKRKEPFEFEDRYAFKPHHSICYIDCNNVLEANIFAPLLTYMSGNRYDFKKKECRKNDIEFVFFSKHYSNYIIVIVEKGLFLSFNVLSADDFDIINDNSIDNYKVREYKPINIEKIIYYSDALGFRFGWFIADCKSGLRNIHNSINKLDSFLKKHGLRDHGPNDLG